MKHSFIHTVFYTMFLICGGCTPDSEMDDREETASGRIPLTIQATASGFDNLPASDHPSTRIPLESGLETFFNTGDAIGIFAVKNTAIADGVNNIKLTYFKTGLTTGDWTPPKGTSLYWSQGMEYIAYYPYKEGVTIDAAQTSDEIVASLADELRPVSDQSTPAKHTACDLMTAIGAITTNDSQDTLNLKLDFRHQFALLILKPQAKFKYVPLESNPIYTYRSTLPEWIVDVTAKDVKINDCNPCKMDDGSYRAIVFPRESSRITGSYKTTDINNGTDKTLNYSGNKSLSFVAGNCYTLEVQSPMASSEKKRALAPGDFVFFNDRKIEIYPGDGDFEGTKIPEYEKAVGMVITCAPDRMTDKQCNDKGWNHAYVMGLFDTFKEGKRGDSVDEPIDEMTQGSPEKIRTNMNGYSDTEKILETYPNDDKYSAFNRTIQQYRNEKKLPANTCSPWFMPSIGQWWDVLDNICGKSPIDFKDNTTAGFESHSFGTETKEKLNKQLAKVGKSLGALSSDYRHIFWSSTEYDKERGWIIIWHFQMWDDGSFWDRIGIKGYAKSSDYKVLPFFAF